MLLLTSPMLTSPDRGRGVNKKQNLADVICERSLTFVLGNSMIEYRMT